MGMLKQVGIIFWGLMSGDFFIQSMFGDYPVDCPNVRNGPYPPSLTFVLDGYGPELGHFFMHQFLADEKDLLLGLTGDFFSYGFRCFALVNVPIGRILFLFKPVYPVVHPFAAFG